METDDVVGTSRHVVVTAVGMFQTIDDGIVSNIGTGVHIATIGT